ncbi:MAG: YfhO family protein [FCB group bacterium]|jgi:hypothetical protein|nr:YfhO family protein [FCB group bacterium]
MHDGRTRSFRSALLQALLLLALLVAVFPGFFLRGELIVPGDVLMQSPPWSYHAPPGFKDPHNRVMVDVVAAFMPYYAITRASILEGEWPLWNQLEYLGVPMLANMQNAAFYPPRLLHVIFDVFLGQSLYVVLKLWLCGMTAFLCARGIGLKEWPSRFFSVAWMLSSYNVLWCAWSLTDVAAWLPILFLGVELTLDGRYRRGFYATALAGTLLLFAGHPETAFAMGVGMGLYFLFRLAFERRWGRRLWMPVVTLGGAWTLVLLVCASMILPFVEYLLNSSTFFDREHGEPVMFLTPGTIISFWVPRFFGTYAERNYWNSSGFTSQSDSMMYAGMAVWAGVALLFAKGDARKAHRARIACLSASIVVSILLTFDSPPLQWVTKLPMFGSMYLFYHATVAIFAFPLLSAIGMEHWFSRPRKAREFLWALVAVVPAVAIVWYGYNFNYGLLRTSRMLDYIHFQFELAVLFAVLSFLLFAVYAFWKKPRVLMAVIVLVIAADQMVATRGLNPTLERKYVFPDIPLTQFLQSLEQPARVGTGEGNVASGLMPVYGIEELLGYDGLYPARIIRLMKAVEPEEWQAILPALAVGYYLNDPRFDPLFPLKEEPERYRLLGTFDGLEVYRDTKAMPLAFLTAEARSVKGLDDFVALSGQPDFDVTRVAYVEGELSKPLTGSGAAGTATVARRTTNHVVVDVDAAQRVVLVLADAYYPGWRATVDGEDLRVLPVNHVLRGVEVEAGKHRVEFVYFPGSFRIGLTLSVLACLGSIGWIGWEWARGRRRGVGQV